jgi:hypothetical protein
MPVRTLTTNRLIFALLVWGLLSLAIPPRASAQEDTDAPLGDIARSFRKKPAPTESVIDNDNFSKVVDDAQSRRAAGGSPVFSLAPPDKSFHVSAPDVTCSLSFTAKTTSPFSDPLMLDELPRAELAKLDGPAIIDGDSLQVSMHNGSAWELREVVIGLTIVRQSAPGETSSSFGQLRIVPAAGFPAVKSGSQNVPDSYQKQADVTMLLHVKGSAAPSTTATFRTPLNFALFPDQEWHWAIVRAKGIPPQAPAELTTRMQTESGAGTPLTVSGTGSQLPPSLPVLPTLDAASH